MASENIAPLPADVFHLLAEQLARKADFGTLYACIASSKYLASAGAVTALYRLSLGERSPVKGGGGENLTFAEQDVTIMKWSILWRTLLLSALGEGKTLYPYCKHLRELDLRDLNELLERLDEPKYKSKVAKNFFGGDLKRFHHVYQTTGTRRVNRLDIKHILIDVGDLITSQAPLLEGLSEPNSSDVMSKALPIWIPRLSHLQELELWDGEALADETLRNSIHTCCPHISKLRIYRSSGEHADQYLAAFFAGMQPNTLTSFENNSSSSIGQETCLALNSHGGSLRSLKLSLEEEGMLALGLLSGCTRLQTLNVTALRPSVDLKTTQNDVFLAITDWLGRCNDLAEVAFEGLVSAPDLLLPVLLNSNTKLYDLQINAKEGSFYQIKEHHDFHRALAGQTELRSLHLRADAEAVTRDDMEILLDVLCSLHNLQHLDLMRTSEYFSDDHILLLARHMPQLEYLYVGGYGISDAVLVGVSQLSSLKQVTFTGITTFTMNGLLTYIDKLGPGNSKLVLSVDMADPDTMITDEDQEVLRAAMFDKVQGRFEYQPLRDPNMPEFDDESDSD
ncbi:hypothetical protein LTR62_004091 [Meristemomyces frigidus]|uniref:Uncharacterized protein n=1 Tax=Meristemomyces frigidus TaxID=1508187 RepID=A0AAN7TRE2_9PEZI|nr:hypothetical protein LTR62_004091 [Meristemomyces frigidus]